MNEKIVTKESFQLIGIETRTSNEMAMRDIPKIWERFHADGIKDMIPDKSKNDILAIYTDYEGNHAKPYTYILGFSVNSLSAIPKGMVGRSISLAKYEVFTAKGKMPDKLIETWQHIWNPNIDARRSYIADFEVHGDKSGDPNSSEVDVYIGIK